VATVKYYIREGLLPAGTPTAPNQAEYGDKHVRRLRLIRTLREVGGLEIERIRRVVTAIEDEDLSRHDLFGVAQRALESARTSAEVTDEVRQARADVDRFVEGLGWQVRPDAAARDELADALAGLRRLGRDYGTEVFRPYTEAADRMAAWEVRAIPPSEPPSVAVERMVVGSIVFGAIFDALRRLAHEHHSALLASR
jgi:DNA-binding transcriptional MerR regulator